VRVAVLGVGLIGGSVGLAARRRLKAEVAGFDPEPERLRAAAELGAIDREAQDVAAAVQEADLVFCAAPVGALPELVVAALAASSDDAVVTDVGSTKLALVGSLPSGESAERFIGGHPLAGAETSGVENAREDLFDGARWYLTPTDRSAGVHYDRLQRAVSGLGARPQAIDAETHDRLMATVSHVPHVLANALVQQAAVALSEKTEGLPDVGPSFRDSTRVAGANPAMWGDILAANGEAIAASLDAVVDRLAKAAELIRGRDAATLAGWQRDAREDRRRLLEADMPGGELRELRLAVENRPGTVAEIALALGRAGVNIEDMALAPSADMHAGAMSLWVAGVEQADRAAEVVRSLGHSVSIAGGEE
jgi:prephenate dehydrogenase